MQRTPAVMAIAALLLPFGLSAPARAQTVAVVIQVGGRVEVHRPGQAAAEPATVGMKLAPGDHVEVPPGGRAMLLYRSGRMEWATSSVEIRSPQTRPPGTLFSRTVTTLTQVATVDPRKDPNRIGAIRPIAGAPVPVAPRNEIAVLDPRPRFTWFRLDSPGDYTLQLRKLEGGAPLRFRVRQDTTWEIPEAADPLEPGAVYEWTVYQGEAGRAPEPQRFRVASAAERTRIEAELAELAATGIDPASDGLLLAVLLYRDAGFAYEALAALDRLGAQGTVTGRSYHRLKSELLARIGDYEAAARAAAHADRLPAES